jgi:TctA family transporter
MEAMWEALLALLSLGQLAYLALGIFVGLVVGILPGMGGVAGMALLLPFVYGMEQISALAMMIGMLASTAAGDAFASVLMGIPGGSSSATILDGFPLTRQGQAARALSAAFTSSMLGGLFGVVILTASVFVATPLILGVGMGEQLLLILLALTMVGSLAGKSPLKGLAAAGIGLLIGTIGSAPATGEPRYTFGTVYLADGLPLVVLALGVFGLTEVIDLMRQQSTLSQSPELGRGWRQGVVDTFSNWWLVLRVSVLGAIVGILPGVGGSTADWLAYGHVVQSSKDRSKFGKGDIRGVIAPESTNNATRGGDLIPTLFFGIPGSGSMALLLGGFLLIGVRPGPDMVGPNLNLTFVIIWSLALGNVVSAVICMALAAPISKLTMVRYAFIAPVMLVLVVLTAFQATSSWGDIFCLAALTVAGLLLKRFDWSRPALIVGFVLSGGLEASVYQTTQIYGLSFLARPQSMVILAIVLASLGAGIYIMLRPAAADENAGSRAPLQRWPQIAFTLSIICLVVYALAAVYNAHYLTRIFPLCVGIITLALLIAIALQQCFADLSSPILDDIESTSANEGGGPARTLVYMSWFAMFLILSYIVGFIFASPIFIFLFTTVECGRPLWRNALIGLCTAVALALFAKYLYVQYPPSLI